jgi:hypothetical protein
MRVLLVQQRGQNEMLGAGQINRRIQHDRLQHLRIEDIFHRLNRFAMVKAEFVISNSQRAAVNQPCVVDLLAVDECSVAATRVLNPPTILFPTDDRVNPRRQGIGDDNAAIQTATKAVFRIGVQNITCAGARTGQHAQIRLHAAKLWRIPE